MLCSMESLSGRILGVSSGHFHMRFESLKFKTTHFFGIYTILIFKKNLEVFPVLT